MRSKRGPEVLSRSPEVLLEAFQGSSGSFRGDLGLSRPPEVLSMCFGGHFRVLGGPLEVICGRSGHFRVLWGPLEMIWGRAGPPR